ncbi:uncharacterized protein M421DRAFT_4976 [Didymella exigua CBS 183.55]|uniref:F-box domain-containing protein n=1 Tax=Didymella exigua CBS 183.55 TaxID=1150837 RepID=A0A6A5RNA6_9PLEO|nr:uncharacterized protein M421DRAFT_4976 [Didymella exigua CBS 183.55]KAF1928504.1 hypothetical protein M421DRAFT_4976 [Didymella exigua CBS 183.55]
MNRPIKLEYRLFAHEYDAVTQHNAINSPLLRLPAEIRNTIYEYIFDVADATTLERVLSPTSTGRYRVVLSSSRLLHVCRQTRFEARPFQTGSTYSHLDIRIESRHLPDLVNWVGGPQCARVVEIGMFLSLAGAIHRQIRRSTVQGSYTGPWSTSGDQVFPLLKRVIITYPTYINEDAYNVETSLQTLFGNMDLEVEFRAAVYWG